MAGVVDEQPLPTGVHQAHRALLALDPAAVLLAEGAVTVGRLTCAGVVLLPQQLQRHARALELLVQPGMVRLLPCTAAWARWRVQPGPQFVVAEGTGQRSVHPRVADIHRDLANGGLAHSQRGNVSESVISGAGGTGSNRKTENQSVGCMQQIELVRDRQRPAPAKVV